jgi:hypothetical protein
VRGFNECGCVRDTERVYSRKKPYSNSRRDLAQSSKEHLALWGICRLSRIALLGEKLLVVAVATDDRFPVPRSSGRPTICPKQRTKLASVNLSNPIQRAAMMPWCWKHFPQPNWRATVAEDGYNRGRKSIRIRCTDRKWSMAMSERNMDAQNCMENSRFGLATNLYHYT